MVIRNNVKCTFCGKDLGGFVFEHNCDKKVKNKQIWDTRKIGRRGKSKTEKWMKSNGL